MKHLRIPAFLLCLITAFLLFAPAPAVTESLPVVEVTKGEKYLDRDHVAAYITLFKELPPNYLTKSKAQSLGWQASKGNLWKVAPGCAIGGDRFGNYEGLLPQGKYKECDVDYSGGYRDEKRLIFDDKGHIWYTEDHYNSFTPVTVDAREVSNVDEVITEDGQYLDRDSVAYYIFVYGHLPSNYLTKDEARALGWQANKGNLWKVAPGCAIGGDRFFNSEGLLPKGKYKECDVDYAGGFRDEKRLIFDDRGNIWYTEDHYNSFEQLYDEEEK